MAKDNPMNQINVTPSIGFTNGAKVSIPFLGAAAGGDGVTKAVAKKGSGTVNGQGMIRSMKNPLKGQ